MSNREGHAGHGIVWLEAEQVYGEVVGGVGAYFTTVRYTKDGFDYEVLMENDEFELMEDLIEYDSDE